MSAVWAAGEAPVTDVDWWPHVDEERTAALEIGPDPVFVRHCAGQIEEPIGRIAPEPLAAAGTRHQAGLRPFERTSAAGTGQDGQTNAIVAYASPVGGPVSGW